MCAICSYKLEPLIYLTTSKIKLKLTEGEQKQLKEVKMIVAYNNLIDYLDFNKRFEIHTNDSNF